jgi:hypothetical protein
MVTLGGGFRAMPRRAFRALQADIRCWDTPGEWVADPDPAAWMGATAYLQFDRAYQPRGAGSWADPSPHPTPPPGVLYPLTPPSTALAALPHRPYIWRPSRACAAAPLPQFDRAAFCAALGRRRLLLLGDSLTLGHHDALVELLGGAGPVRRSQPTHAGCPGRMAAGSPCLGHAVCGGAAWVQARRNDWLWLDRGYVPGGAGGGGGKRLAHELLTRNRTALDPAARLAPVGEYFLPVDDLLPGAGPPSPPTIVVLNRGLHFQSSREVEAGMRSALAFLRRGGPEGGPPPPPGWRPPLVVYRPTNGYHTNCSDAAVPTTHEAERAAHAARARKRPVGLPEQNARVARLLAAEFEGAVYADVERATDMRVDGHAAPPHDCVHYAGMVGAYDHWVRVLAGVVGMVKERAGEEEEGG